MRAGLAASTVTPGITAPDVSRTTPAMLPDSDCAHAAAGRNRKPNTKTKRAILWAFIVRSLPRALELQTGCFAYAFSTRCSSLSRLPLVDSACPRCAAERLGGGRGI